MLSELPMKPTEDWKYTNLRALKKYDFVVPFPSEEKPRLPKPLVTENRAVLVNGQLQQSPSDMNIRQEEDVVIQIPSNTTMNTPLEILSFSHFDAVPFQHEPRYKIILEENSSLTLVEHVTGEGRYLTHSKFDIQVKRGARLNHYRLQQDSDQAFHIHMSSVHVEQDATYNQFTLTRGACLSRNEIHVTLAGTGATCRLNTLMLVQGEQHADTTNRVDHKAEHGTSEQICKTLLKDKASAVFQGKTHVHPLAQKTNAHQLSRALLLSDQATMNTKPELEIYADDVKCSHGATMGALDENMIFYLRSRGLSFEQARGLLIQAFISEALRPVSNPILKAVLENNALQY